MDGDDGRSKRVCFLGADAEMFEAVSGRLTNYDVEVLGFSDAQALIGGMGPPSDAVLVLDTRVLRKADSVALLLKDIEGVLGERPVFVCLSHSSEIELRLQVLRAGAEGFFAGPVVPESLATRLLELSGILGDDGHRILIVDDHPVAALFAARVLQSVGMETRIVGDALDVLEVLDDFSPDLVLMDLHMPGADGIELTTLIREHEEHYATPVVFLSSELDSGRQLQALRVGGDDFIAKPVRPDQLIESVRHGVRSSRSWRRRSAASGVRSRDRERVGDASSVHNPQASVGKDAQADAQLKVVLEEALISGGFHLMHQPILALQRLPGERYETTLRLEAGEGEYLPAREFLPAALRWGLMPAIDRWVLEKALDELEDQRNARNRGLRYFIHQTMETLCAQNWLQWFRDALIERDLIMQRPVLQFHLNDLYKNRELAATRFRELQRLSIKTCVKISENAFDGLDLIEDLDIDLVRLPLRIADASEAKGLAAFVEHAHALGSKVIAANVEHPQAIARAWGCGVDFVQGNFLQLPSEELSFDFSETTLV